MWRIGKTGTKKDLLVSLRQRVAVAARELSEEQAGESSRKITKGGTSQGSLNPLEFTEFSVKHPRRFLRLARKSMLMALDESDSDYGHNANHDDSK